MFLQEHYSLLGEWSDDSSQKPRLSLGICRRG